LIAAATSTGQIFVWNAENKTNIASFTGHSSSVNQLIFIAGLGKLISIGADGNIKSWNTSNFQAKENLIYQAGEKLTSASLNPNNKSYAVASENGIIRIFDAENDKIVKTITGKEGKILSICWGINDELVIGYASGKIEFIRKNDIIQIFAHESGINDIEYDNFNKRLISCGYDGKIKIWNMENIDAEPAIIEAHNNWIYCFAYNPVHASIISGGAEKSIIISKINIEDLKTLIRKNISANMSYKNWLYYVGNDIEYNKNLPKE
jgi:WD40 repeat protein